MSESQKKYKLRKGRKSEKVGSRKKQEIRKRIGNLKR